ncbi:hypothetical protein BS78_03G121800 [Paspalum vaginatum]|nr:hypothetical protein BS78_03G121800 [Paspalum vaginatum]
MSVDIEYYAAFTKLSSQLDSMTKYEHQNMMFHFVMGLRSDFEPLRAQLLGRPTPPTMTEALSAAIAEETRLCTLASSSDVSQHSVLAASSSRPPCKHCGKKTHREEQCFKKHPELLAQFRARRASSQKGTASTAQAPLTSAPPVSVSSIQHVGASMSAGSIIPSPSTGSSNPSSSWYWPSP